MLNFSYRILCRIKWAKFLNYRIKSIIFSSARIKSAIFPKKDVTSWRSWAANKAEGILANRGDSSVEALLLISLTQNPKIRNDTSTEDEAII